VFWQRSHLGLGCLTRPYPAVLDRIGQQEYASRSRPNHQKSWAETDQVRHFGQGNPPGGQCGVEMRDRGHSGRARASLTSRRSRTGRPRWG